MDKCEDNSEDNMLKTVQKNIWYAKLASFLTESPFFNGHDDRGAQLLFEKLGEAIEQGDSCLKLEQMPVDCMEIVQSYQANAVMHKPMVWDAPYLYLQRYWALEQQLAQSLQTLLAQPIALASHSYDDLFEDQHQRDALKKGISLPFCMITGGPGTGKTFILTRIVAVLKAMHSDLRIAMAAPTGKASQRMQEALQAAFSDPALVEAGLYHPDFKQQQTQTLHRLLGMGNRQTPKYHQDNPLPYDVVVIDEASMLDLNMAKALFSAIAPPTRLLLLGDANQLSSVDVGYVLSDLQQVPQLKKYHQTLVKSRRFFDDAMIGRFAHYIYQGKACIATDPLLFTAASKYHDFSLQQWQCIVQPQSIQHTNVDIDLSAEQDWVGYFPLSDDLLDTQLETFYHQLAQGYNDYIKGLMAFQQNAINKVQLADIFDRYRILVAMRHGKLGLTDINQIMTHHIKQRFNISQDAEWYLGRPVMMTYNDYQLGLSNGDIGICWTEVHPQSGETTYQVYFPSLQRDVPAARLPQSIQTAYALTIHKSQGSEFRHTAVVLDHKAEQLLSKELLYTAITRAKKMVSIYADKRALEQSFNIRTQRQSGLQQQLERILVD